MRKVGIVSLFNLNNVNYGNRLQAYALNYYLGNNYTNLEVYSLLFSNLFEAKYKTANLNIWKYLKNKIRRGYLKLTRQSLLSFEIGKRMERLNSFCIENISMIKEPLKWEDLNETNYDVFIVGSDIIWGQTNGYLNKIAFLDFKNKSEFKRIAYAPSFGRDWIPNENVSKLKEYLERFEAVSVRENSSVQMLEDVGVRNVVHVLDPTLLLSASEWHNIEEKPNIEVKEYIFVYLLGKDKSIRAKITSFAKKMGLKIITVPYANGENNNADKNFGDVPLMDCSIQEWIWLIHHAEYIITDSFHGTVFSTIFNKKFLVVMRQFEEDINNRMVDYLHTIHQSDKFVDLDKIDIDLLEWDYVSINKILEEKRILSKEFLDKALR